MKKFKIVLIGFIATFLFGMNVYAASGSIKASTSAGTVAVGSTFNVTVTASCSDKIGSWQFGVTYDSSVISLVSGDTNVAGFGDGSAKSKSYTYKFKAIKSGTAKINIFSPTMVAWDDPDTLFIPGSSGTSVTVKTQAEIQASLSKDNNLKSLSVEGYELSPAFDKNTTEYTVSVPDTVETIKVHAQVNDSRARVSGAGEINISEGSNKVEVIVTAQNGSIKKYTINVDVRDLNPISVTVGNTSYTVVKKSDLLTAPTGFSETTIKIDDIDVPAFTSAITNMVVVGLKSEDGTVSMFKYDSDTNTYTLYDEIKGSSITLYPIEIASIPRGFEKTKLTINEKEYDVLKSTSVSDFYLVYAMNVETGKIGYYIYDPAEHSFIAYNEEAFNSTFESIKELKLYLIALAGVATIFLLISIIIGAKNSKLKKMVSKFANEKYNLENTEEVPQEETVEEITHDEDLEDETFESDTKPKKKKTKKK